MSQLRRFCLCPAIILVLAILATRPTHAGAGVWTQIGPYGGTVRALLFDPTHPGVVYAGTAENGVFKSRDGGSSWQVIAKSAGFYPLALTADPASPGVLWAACAGSEVPRGTCRSSDGETTWEGSFTFRSTDHGETWVASGPGGYSIAAGPGGFVVTGSGSRSLDGGETWRPGPGIDGQLLSLAANPLVARRALAGSEQRGVYKTTNGAASWDSASRGMAVDPNDPRTLYAGTETRGFYAMTLPK